MPKLSDSLLLTILYLVWQCQSILAKVAGFGKSSGGRTSEHPSGEIDYGMPITDPAVMIPLIGAIIIFTTVVCVCCFRAFSSDDDARKNAQNQRLQQERKKRSRSRSPEVGFMKNGDNLRNGTKSKEQGKIAKLELGDLPYDCYRPAVKVERQTEQLV